MNKKKKERYYRINKVKLDEQMEIKYKINSICYWILLVIFIILVLTKYFT